MIRSLCFAATIACMVGSVGRVESRTEGGTEDSLSSGDSVSSSSFTLSVVREGAEIRELVLQGLKFGESDGSVLESLSGEDWRRAFPVSVVPTGNAISEALPSMSGRYSVAASEVRFVPRFGFQSGVAYRATFKPSVFALRLKRRVGDEISLGLDTGESPLELRFGTEPARALATAEVAAIYPSSDQLPENLLKFYLHFSQPMSLGTLYRHIHLEREDGSEVAFPFLQLDEELWDPAGSRMTLLIDPGRIKSGLVPRNEVGPSLEEGKAFRLVVDAAWPDSEGVPLKEKAVKSFRVVPPDVERPTMASWKLSVPAVGTRDPLEIRFPEPMDHALLERVVWVVDAHGVEIEGEIGIGDRETRWQFIPTEAWEEGIFELCAENSLEDLAGNSLGRLFEVDSFTTVSRRVERETLKRAFQIKARP